MARVFSRRNFYPVLSVHVYGIYFVVTGQDIACSVRERE